MRVSARRYPRCRGESGGRGGARGGDTGGGSGAGGIRATLDPFPPPPNQSEYAAYQKSEREKSEMTTTVNTPMLWGFDREPITHFKVKHATLRLTRLRALDLHSAEYAPVQAVLPAIWGSSTTGAADPLAVQALATRQQSLFAAKSAPASRDRRRPRPSDANLAALYHQPWMQPCPARPLPADRAALRRDAAVVSPYATDDCRYPLAVQAAARPAWREAWAKVHAADRHRHHRVFAWLLMHAALKCGEAKVQFWPVGADGLAETACCGHNACRPQPALNPPAAGQLETLLQCPAGVSGSPACAVVGRPPLGAGRRRQSASPHTSSLDPGQLCHLAATGLPAPPSGIPSASPHCRRFGVCATAGWLFLYRRLHQVVKCQQATHASG